LIITYCSKLLLIILPKLQITLVSVLCHISHLMGVNQSNLCLFGEQCHTSTENYLLWKNTFVTIYVVRRLIF
jgi:hypothetical protein